MRLIEKIINEEINNLINEKNSKGVHRFVNHDDENKFKKNVSAEDEKSVRKDTDKPIINIAALARKVYPDHTPEGAQSQLRKIKGETNDNGSEYHLKNDEASTVRKELSDI